MKKLLLKFWRFLNSIFLQILLTVVGYNSWEMAIELGSETYSADGSINKNFGTGQRSSYIPTDVDVAAGFDGGAIAMGLITCVYFWNCLASNK
jgi:hypothetical protein